MFKIIIYGLKKSDVLMFRDFIGLQANGNIEIVGEISVQGERALFGKPIVLSEIFDIECDKIICCNSDFDYLIKEIKNDENSVDVESFAEFIKPYHEETKKAQLSILKELIDANDIQIADRKWMREKIFKYGFMPYKKSVENAPKGVHWTTLGCLQIPEEFLEFCLYISSCCFQKAIEIGVYTGKTSFIIAAILYRNNPDLVYEMVDVYDHMQNFEGYKKLIPALNKRIPNNSNDFKGDVYDYVFIDGDHQYSSVITDWQNVGVYAKSLTVFHDIYAHEYDRCDGGTVRAWLEAKRHPVVKNIREFSVFKDEWMGIGVLEL